jgi:hypothetical protein
MAVVDLVSALLVVLSGDPVLFFKKDPRAPAESLLLAW